MAAALVVAGMLFAASARAAGGDDLRDDVSDLESLIREETASVDAAAERVDSLRTEVEQLTGAVDDATVRRLQDRADFLAGPAGFEPVEGPGIVVTLDDAPLDRPLPEGVDPDLLVVHQQDLQDVVNALWAGGAEAMMLMDQRVISTSAVRCVGSTLRLQGRLYSPPYTIRAIGDPDELQEALDDSRAVQVYRDYARVFGLGYTEELQGSIEMPGFTGALELQHASVPVEWGP